MFPVFHLARKSLARAAAALSFVTLAACVPAAGPQVGTGAGSSGKVTVALLVPSGSGQASDEALARAARRGADGARQAGSPRTARGPAWVALRRLDQRGGRSGGLVARESKAIGGITGGATGWRRR